MKISEAKARRMEVIARRMEITAALIESKRAWVEEGAGLAHGPRLALEAEAARLELEKLHLDKHIHAAKSAMSQYRNTLAHAQLIRLVTEAGHADLVVQADRLAMDMTPNT